MLEVRPHSSDHGFGIPIIRGGNVSGFKADPFPRALACSRVPAGRAGRYENSQALKFLE